MHTAAAQPLQIHCAEIWGGIAVRQDEISTPGLDAAIHSTASGDAKGGDIYYFSVCGYDALTRIAIADVRGHGNAVSHLSEWLYTALEAQMNDSNGAAVLTNLNEMVRTKGFQAITTAVVATFHRDSGTLYYAYAGHPPALLWSPGNGWQSLQSTETKGPANLPLGVLPNARYTQERTTIRPGDRLFLYSDGIAECPGPGDELYGDTRMLTALQTTERLPLPDARNSLRHDLTTYAGGTLTHDDCTFLLIEPKPARPFWQRRIFPARRRARQHTH